MLWLKSETIFLTRKHFGPQSPGQAESPDLLNCKEIKGVHHGLVNHKCFYHAIKHAKEWEFLQKRSWVISSPLVINPDENWAWLSPGKMRCVNRVQVWVHLIVRCLTEGWGWGWSLLCSRCTFSGQSSGQTRVSSRSDCTMWTPGWVSPSKSFDFTVSSWWRHLKPEQGM